MFAASMGTKFRCKVGIANMMAENSHKSELITQLLFNDLVELLEDGAIWMKVQNKFNKTEGFVLKAQFDEISEMDFDVPATHIQFISTKYHPPAIQSFPGTFYYNEDIALSNLHPILSIQRDQSTLETILFSYLDVAYMWGGITHAGIDCSGLSQMLYRFLGIPLTSFASEQFELGTLLDFLQDAQCGDLAFFENEENEISHVGILLNTNEIIHASEKSGKVVIDFLDNEGIISKNTGKRTHKLRAVKRI